MSQRILFYVSAMFFDLVASKYMSSSEYSWIQAKNDSKRAYGNRLLMSHCVWCESGNLCRRRFRCLNSKKDNTLWKLDIYRPSFKSLHSESPKLSFENLLIIRLYNLNLMKFALSAIGYFYWGPIEVPGANGVPLLGSYRASRSWLMWFLLVLDVY